MDVYLLESVNLFIGDADPDKSKHLVLQSLALPTLERVTADHLGGGASAEVAWSMGALRKLEPTFKLAGFDEQASRAVTSGRIETFTGRGLIRRKSDGAALKAVAVIRGILSRGAPDNFDRTNIFGHDHTIAECTAYSLTVGTKTWIDWDLFEHKLIRFGEDMLAEERRILAIGA